jgi:hypothetical protein
MTKKLLDVTMKEREAPKEEVVVKKAGYDWCYENSLNQTKIHYDVEGIVEHKYLPWRTNRSLSNYSDTINHAQYMNMSAHLDLQLQFDYYFHSIRKKKRFFKKPKVEKDNNFHIVQQYYKYNNNRTEEALAILTKAQIDIIAKKQEKGGIK